MFAHYRTFVFQPTFMIFIQQSYGITSLIITLSGYESINIFYGFLFRIPFYQERIALVFVIRFVFLHRISIISALHFFEVSKISPGFNLNFEIIFFSLSKNFTQKSFHFCFMTFLRIFSGDFRSALFCFPKCDSRADSVLLLFWANVTHARLLTPGQRGDALPELSH